MNEAVIGRNCPNNRYDFVERYSSLVGSIVCLGDYGSWGQGTAKDTFVFIL